MDTFESTATTPHPKAGENWRTFKDFVLRRSKMQMQADASRAIYENINGFRINPEDGGPVSCSPL
jgi:hypothetical protein